MGSATWRLAAAAAIVVSLPSLLLPAVRAHPYRRDDLPAVGFAYLLQRDCATYCGADNQYCCSSDEVCYTSSGIAGCSSTSGGAYGVYVTTWTETETFTSTITTSWAASTATGGGGGGGGGGGDCVPQLSGEEACGSICCASWQYCAYKGQCVARETSVPISTYTTNGQVTTEFSQPYRITGGSTVRATSTAGVAAGASAGGGSHLSAGAIAGIVIGTILGIALLLLLCFCCVVRGLWGMIFGGGKSREREKDRRRSRSRTVVTTEERYTRRGSSAYSTRDRHRTWFGRTTSPAVERREKKKGENRIMVWLMAIVGTLTALLFLNKKKKHRKTERSTTTTTGTGTGTGTGSRSRSYTQSSWSESELSSTSGGRGNFPRRARGAHGTIYSHSSRRRE